MFETQGLELPLEIEVGGVGGAHELLELRGAVEHTGGVVQRRGEDVELFQAAFTEQKSAGDRPILIESMSEVVAQVEIARPIAGIVRFLEGPVVGNRSRAIAESRKGRIALRIVSQILQVDDQIGPIGRLEGQDRCEKHPPPTLKISERAVVLVGA